MDEEKRISQCALVQVEEPVHESDDVDYDVRLVIDGFYRAALTEKQVAEIYGVTEERVTTVLDEYASGMHGVIKFSPQFHDRLVSYYYEHPDESVESVVQRFHLRYNAIRCIVSGRNYAGGKYDKSTVADMYSVDVRHKTRGKYVRKPTTSADIIDGLRAEIDELKERNAELSDKIAAMSSRHEMIVGYLKDMLHTATMSIG